jgi:hypothetical protein
MRLADLLKRPYDTDRLSGRPAVLAGSTACALDETDERNPLLRNFWGFLPNLGEDKLSVVDSVDSRFK